MRTSIGVSLTTLVGDCGCYWETVRQGFGAVRQSYRHLFHQKRILQEYAPIVLAPVRSSDRKRWVNTFCSRNLRNLFRSQRAVAQDPSLPIQYTGSSSYVAHWPRLLKRIFLPRANSSCEQLPSARFPVLDLLSLLVSESYCCDHIHVTCILFLSPAGSF
jgi:hypothetical protein